MKELESVYVYKQRDGISMGELFKCLGLKNRKAKWSKIKGNQGLLGVNEANTSRFGLKAWAWYGKISLELYTKLKCLKPLNLGKNHCD